MPLAGPELPPLLTGRAVPEGVEPFDQACSWASEGKADAGDVLWSRSERRAAAAIVLEPEVPLSRSLQMGPLLQVALVDSLGALLPPRVPVRVRWPQGLLVNNAVAGRTRIGVPATEPGDVPDWLVVGFHVQLAFDASHEPGDTPDETALFEEGGGDLTRDAVIRSVASHFLSWLNTWQSDGFPPVRDRWLQVAEGREAAAPFMLGGRAAEARVAGLDDDVRLIVIAADRAEWHLPFADWVEAPGRSAVTALRTT